MKVKIESSEMSLIAQIVEEYRAHDKDLNEADIKLQQLAKQKDEIVGRIKSTEMKEKILMSLLEQKYGAGKLDILTFEYTTE